MSSHLPVIWHFVLTICIIIMAYILHKKTKQAKKKIKILRDSNQKLYKDIQKEKKRTCKLEMNNIKFRTENRELKTQLKEERLKSIKKGKNNG